jgi:ferredoxin
MNALRAGGSLVGVPVRADNGDAFYQYFDGQVEPLIAPTVFPVTTIKEFFFPKTETLYTFKREGASVTVSDAVPFTKPQVIFCARPCEAAAIPIIDPLFAWDYQDRFYQSRREMTTIVTLACAAPDKNCFCTSVGLSPDTTNGADAVLLSVDNDTFEVRCLTEKGEKLFDGKTTESDKTGSFGQNPPIQFDAAELRERLQKTFASPLYADEPSVRCVGCGACAFVCPTCHCFDMVDTGSVNDGRKVRNWDSCQFKMFTHHASGHNPRRDQGERQRQRVQHKFVIYPEKFDHILCTGCGNCTRSCICELGILPVLKVIAK